MRPTNPKFRTPLDVAYPRPTRLSDPYHDFSDDLTHAILAKLDSELAWDDFQNILGPFLPAGTYEESVYFLPLALEYIAAHDDNALDLITSIVWFISEYADRLAADGLLAGSRERVGECFRMWTSRFEVIHFDRAACRAKGWGLTYFDYVKYAEVVCVGTSDLVRFVRHADLAKDFFRSLADYGSDAVRAAWFLEMSRSQDDVYHPPEHKTIRQLLADESLIRSAAALVRSSLVAGEHSPTYWRDTFAAVGAA
jgi:hypothetical protein